MTDEIKVGGWIVWNDCVSLGGSPRYECREVSKASPKTASYRYEYIHRDRRIDRSRVLFCGPEDAARSLCARLNSSAGLMRNEVCRSKDRHVQRLNAEVTKAKESQDAPAA